MRALAPLWPAVLRAARAHVSQSDRVLFVVFTLLVHEGMYFGFNGLFVLFEHMRWFERCCSQPGAPRAPAPNIHNTGRPTTSNY